MPDAISLPRQHGILRLTLEGAAIAQPLIEGERLWLGKAPGAGDRSTERFAHGARVPAHRRRRADDADHLRRPVCGGQPSDRNARTRAARGIRSHRPDEQPAGAPRRKRPAEGAGRAGRMASSIDRTRARRSNVVSRDARNRQLAKGRNLGIQRRSGAARRERRRRNADRSEPDERAVQGSARVRRNRRKRLEAGRAVPRRSESVSQRLLAGAQHLALVRRIELHRARHARRQAGEADPPRRDGSFPAG